MASTICSLIHSAEKGDKRATDELFNALYTELHRLAKRELARRGAPASISVTTLLHEAYLGMAKRERPCFPEKACFMAYAVRVMRGIVIDHMRSRSAIKRGGQFEITSLGSDVENLADTEDLSSISAALEQLEKVEPELAELVDLKFFCGFSFAEIAALQSVSERTIQRKWEKARVYLHHTIREGVSL
jgi:RNA polymerase sigma factor (TIGR02999 family)